jgi:NADP-reducing hydrogenase subunit HndB
LSRVSDLELILNLSYDLIGGSETKKRVQRSKEKCMPAVKSFEELKRIANEAQQKKELGSAPQNVQVIVTIGSCGIAAGAEKTMKAILDSINREKISSVTVTKTGCIGLCEYEPIVQVIRGGEPRVVYGRINARAAEKIVKQHGKNGLPVKENIIPI